MTGPELKPGTGPLATGRGVRLARRGRPGVRPGASRRLAMSSVSSAARDRLRSSADSAATRCAAARATACRDPLISRRCTSPASRARPVDNDAFAHVVRSAVGDIVARQVKLGIDVVSDGEMSKNGSIDYTRERIDGFHGRHRCAGGALLRRSRAGARAHGVRLPEQAPCTTGRSSTAALAEHPTTEAFPSAASPGFVAMCSPQPALRLVRRVSARRIRR